MPCSSHRSEPQSFEMTPMLHWRTTFDMYDLDKDGYISLKEMKKSIRSEMENYKNIISEETLDEIMDIVIRNVDLDRNGYIDLTEFERLHWTRVFILCDRNNDGKISVKELSTMFKTHGEHTIPIATVKRLMEMADSDGNKQLDFEEFLKLVHMKEFHSIAGDILNNYIRLVVVPRYRRPNYEQEYSCSSPILCMVIISILEIALFAWDAFKDSRTDGNGPVATALLYDPKRRCQAWRYLTYMFVHGGAFHLIVNLVIQIVLGIPLEIVHHWWRVLVVYLGGVLFGSLGQSICHPYVRLVGASGGVFALTTAHIASIVMNFSEMRFAALHILLSLVVFASTIGENIYRYVNDQDDQIAFAAHLFGALAGFLLGIIILRNLRVLKYERVLWWVSIFMSIGFMLVAVVWNAAFPSYFPHQESCS